ncbi:MAG: M23 family metallopeptidase [Candidatus Binatia bacterium]|nr:M23 family metallopeptidase [Candidatus Binatia bacterium]
MRPGDTLSAIGQRYGVPYQEIARLNNIRDPDRIEVGQRLRIPRRAAHSSAAPASSRQLAALPPPSSRARSYALPRDEGPRSGSGMFGWPLEGTVTSGFGPRNGSFHDGIDIAAPVGTPVLAAADGEVIFSDELRGYGKVVIIRHNAQYVTVYAHNRVNWVKEGQFVRRGQRIAEVGQSGRTSGPSLHFEVRKNNLAQDPLRYLPSDRRTVRETHAP